MEVKDVQMISALRNLLVTQQKYREWSFKARKSLSPRSKSTNTSSTTEAELSISKPVKTSKRSASYSVLSFICTQMPSISLKLEQLFEDLYELYAGTNWVSYNECQDCIHIVVIKQFWYDNFLSSQKLKKSLLESTGRNTWISADLFSSSLLSISKPKKNLFSFIKPKISKEQKKRKLVHRSLFFFSLLADEKSMSVNSLLEVFLLAKKMKKIPAQNYTNMILEEFINVPYVSLDDFYKVITKIM